MEFSPAYNVSAWIKNGAATVPTGVQCSASGAFCFLCQFKESEDDSDIENPVTDMKATIQCLAKQKKELNVIVDTIYSKYQEFRDEITYIHPISQETITKSDWSKESIQTHLIYSTEFPSIFSNSVIHIYQSIIMQLNSQIICNTTGEVREEVRKALTQTIESLGKWKKLNE